MNTSATRQREEIESPESAFRSPLDLAHCHNLSLDQKLEALERWEQDVQARLAATSEGMPANGTSSADLDLIKEIAKVTAALKANDNE